MSTPFIAEIRLFSGSFAPRGWMLCAGQILSIAQNTALFSLIGTTYGGNGTTTFALPDLRGRAAVGVGQGPGLSSWSWGERGGVETVTLTSTQIPAHTHQLMAGTGTPTTNDPAGAVLPTGTSRVYASGAGATALAATSVAVAGGSQPHTNIQPSLALNYIIAVQGIFPSRN